MMNMNNNITLDAKDYDILIHFDSGYEEPDFSLHDYYVNDKSNHFAKDLCKELVMNIEGTARYSSFFCPILISRNRFKIVLNYELIYHEQEREWYNVDLNDMSPLLLTFTNDNHYDSELTNNHIIDTIKNIAQTKISERRMNEDYYYFNKKEDEINNDIKTIKLILIDLFENKKIVETVKHRFFFKEAI